ncbi:MAG: sulfatase-like hydrolase/transferase [Cyclobacteriaceae bacterium]|nr:sulfatase-like hydrolase/transferase [Cyclobacteriaceae bacterium]
MLKNIRSYPIAEVLLKLGLVMVLFTITRLLFYLFNLDSFQTTSLYQLSIIFLGGLRFDLSAALYINSLYAILMLIPVNGKNHKAYRAITSYFFYITNAVALLMNCVDFTYYKFTSKRTTITVFEEFANEENYFQLAYNMVLDYFLVVLVWLLLVFILIVVSKKLVKPLQKIESIKTFLLQTISFVVFLGLSVLGMRSGLPPKQDFPLAPSDAGQYVENPGDIVLVQNTPFTMMMSLDKPVFPKQSYFDNATLEVEYPLLKTPKDTAVFKPLNVVLIIVESLGRETVGAFNRNLDGGAYKGYTPFLDSLIESSYIFVNSYANSRISIEGSPAVLASIPSLQESFTVSNYSGNKINSLATELTKKGYHTSFFHGAPNGSLGLNSFVVQAGVEHYYGLNEYGNEDDYDGVWGIWDHLFLPYAINTIDEFEEPFLSTIFSVSSHHPHKIPTSIVAEIPEGKIKMHKSIGYADYALRKLFATAKTKDWYANTLFVITGDHTCTPYHAEYKTSVGSYTVPIILFQPGSNLVGADSTVAQQIDIMPTVLSYLNYDQPYFAFGEDMLNPKEDKFSISYYGNAFQLIMADWVLQYDLKQVVGLFNLKEDPTMKNNLANTNLEVQARMETKIKAVIQQYNNRMVDDKLTVETY